MSGIIMTALSVADTVRNMTSQQQDQTDYPQSIWVSEYTKHDGYGVSSMLKNPGSTP